MKYIFEMKNGIPYLYREDEKHHKKIEKKGRCGQKKKNKLDISILDDECDLTILQEEYGPNFYFVIDAKEK